MKCSRNLRRHFESKLEVSSECTPGLLSYTQLLVVLHLDKVRLCQQLESPVRVVGVGDGGGVNPADPELLVDVDRSPNFSVEGLLGPIGLLGH